MLFLKFDKDRSGSVDYRELHELLRQGKSISLDAALMPGGAGKITIHSKNSMALRGGPGRRSSLRRVDLDESEGARPVHEQLRDILSAQAVRVCDLFRDFDTNGDGVVVEGAKEGHALLGIGRAAGGVDRLFESWDRDGSGPSRSR